MVKVPVKKTFFKKPSISEVLADKRIIDLRGLDESLLYDALVGEALDAREDVCIVSNSPFTDTKYYKNPEKFLRKGPAIAIEPRYALMQLENLLFGQAIFACSYDNAHIVADASSSRTSSRTRVPFARLQYSPLVGKDMCPREYNLLDALEGAKLYVRSAQLQLSRGLDTKTFFEIESLPGIKIKSYMRSSNQGLDAQCIIRIMSSSIRTPHDMKLIGIPDVNPEHAYSWQSSHACKHKDNENLGDKKQVVHLCKHDIAGMIAVAQYFSEVLNCELPQQTLPILLPTPKLVTVYERLRRFWLIGNDNTNNKHTLPNRADYQAVIDRCVRNGKSSDFFLPQGSDVSVLGRYKW